MNGSGMFPFLKCRWYCLALCLAPVFTAVAEDFDPAEAWDRAYSWLQTGERLAESGQWSLAMGGFIEAHRQMKEIQEVHPSFEPELVAYRVGKLDEMIADAQGRLPPGGTAITTKFLDFIESYDEGMRLRFSNRYAEALDTLDVAKVLLDEIIYENPDQFRDAVDTQYTFLHSSLAWLDQQINYRQRSRRVTHVPDGVEWGTTEYVSESDLPGERDAVLPSAELFPNRPTPDQIRDLQTVPGVLESNAGNPEGEPGEKENPSGGGRDSRLPAFRMSSKQKEPPVEEGELPAEAE